MKAVEKDLKNNFRLVFRGRKAQRFSMKQIRLLMAAAILACGLIFPLLTGCGSLGGGGDTLLSLGQQTYAAYQLYQAEVAAGRLKSDPDIAEQYLKYREKHEEVGTMLKPKDTPPPALAKAAADLTNAITAAKDDATKAKAAQKAAQ